MDLYDFRIGRTLGPNSPKILWHGGDLRLDAAFTEQEINFPRCSTGRTNTKRRIVFWNNLTPLCIVMWGILGHGGSLASCTRLYIRATGFCIFIPVLGQETCVLSCVKSATLQLCWDPLGMVNTRWVADTCSFEKVIRDRALEILFELIN